MSLNTTLQLLIRLQSWDKPHSFKGRTETQEERAGAHLSTWTTNKIWVALVKRMTVEKTSTWGPGDEVQKEDRGVYFVFSETLSCLSPRQGNAIISGSEDVKKGACCSSLCNFATRARMGWEDLFVIVRPSALGAPLPVWRSTCLAQVLFLCVIPLSPSLPPQFLDLIFTWWLPFISLFFFSSSSAKVYILPSAWVSVILCSLRLYYTHFIFLPLLLIFGASLRNISWLLVLS